MLRYRLIFGALMIVVFVGLVLLDGYLDGSLSGEAGPVQGTILCVLVALLAVPAQLEMAALVGRGGAKLFVPVAVLGSVLWATSGYWPQFSARPAVFALIYLQAVAVGILVLIWLCQAVRYGTERAIANIAANYFSIVYLGLLSSFVVGIRLRWGPWALLMFIFTVKLADTGAYFTGRWLGRHPFSPRISPKKTWEGLAGAIVASAVTGAAFAGACGIMTWTVGAGFGALFGVLGQYGDLAESMMKRDARIKDSAAYVPGFGGVLDVIDSPLATAPPAWLFFYLVCH
ncbi:MAG TPA: hypothetical protein ENN87_01535 [Phycisphaerales bacterium]|nr:hypothetical protein [Phycisphaerales bacterium]